MSLASCTGSAWDSLGRGRASLRLPRDLRFRRKGVVPEVIWIGPDDEAAALRLVRQLKRAKWVAVDTEFDLTTQDMIMWSVSDGKVRAAVSLEALRWFRELLEAPEPRKIMHNASADLPVFAKQGVKVPLSADTLAMDYYVDENRLGRHGLKECAAEWLGIQMTDFSDVYGKRKKGEPFPELRGLMLDNLPVSTDYASLDAYATWHLFALHKRILKATQTSLGYSLWDAYRRYEVPYLQALSEMSEVGIALDPAVLDEIGVEYDRTVTRCRWVMQYLLPETVQVKTSKGVKAVPRDDIKTTSNQEMSAIFYDVLGRVSMVPDAPRSVREDNLRVWAESGCLLSAVLLDLRGALKMRQDFVGYRRGDPAAIKDPKRPTDVRKGLLHHMTQDFDGAPFVVRTTLKPDGAATGRASSSNPNLQQIPSKQDKDVYRIRRAFVPRPGCILVVADYDQAELRVLAHQSRDPVLIKSFAEGIDIHAQTAKAAFGLTCDVGDVKALHPEKRAAAKVINFGINYGMSPKGLALKLNVSEREADKFIRAFFKLYRGVHKWIEATKAQAHRNGYVETLVGRRRRLPNIRLDDYGLVGQAERQAINAPIQGGVADIMRAAMARIRKDRRLRDHEAKPLLQVHDELIFECPVIDAVQVRDRVQALMEGAVKLRVPLKADAHLGPHWEAAKGGKWEEQNGYARH